MRQASRAPSKLLLLLDETVGETSKIAMGQSRSKGCEETTGKEAEISKEDFLRSKPTKGSESFRGRNVIFAAGTLPSSATFIRSFAS